MCCLGFFAGSCANTDTFDTDILLRMAGHYRFKRKGLTRVLTLLAGAACGLPMLLTRWWPHLMATDFYFWYWLLGSILFIVLLLLAAVASAVGLVVSRKWPALSMKARALALLLGLGLVPVVVVGFTADLLAGSLPTGSYARKFDRSSWTASPPSVRGDITPRQKMLGDVVENLLPGKSRNEIEEMLGKSEVTSYFEETGRDLIYMTGPERDTPFSIDSEWLLIWLDENSRFQRYAIYRD